MMAATMENNEPCACSKVTELRLENLGDDLRELKDRVQRLETTLTRGVMLLIANLAAVVVTLAQQLIRH